MARLAVPDGESDLTCAWYGSTKTLDMHISVLRRKLGDDASQPSYITTIRGVGFRFDAPEE